MEGLRYIGDGTLWRIFKQPVPPRDLTADEVKFYGGKKQLLASGLYEEVRKDGDFITDKKDSDWA